MDGVLAIVAGADTTSSVLAGIFANLLRNRDIYDRLRREVDTTFPPGEGELFDAAKMCTMQLLNAVM